MSELLIDVLLHLLYLLHLLLIHSHRVKGRGHAWLSLRLSILTWSWRETVWWLGYELLLKIMGLLMSIRFGITRGEVLRYCLGQLFRQIIHVYHLRVIARSKRWMDWR